MLKTVVIYSIGLIGITLSSLVLSRYKEDNPSSAETYKISLGAVRLVFLLLTTGCILAILFVLDIFANRDVQEENQMKKQAN